MDARHRIRIIAAAVAVAALTGGRAIAGDEIPDTELGRAVLECIRQDPEYAGDFQFFDDGLSVGLEVESPGQTDHCMMRELDLPDWVSRTSNSNLGGVLKFGDWSVLPDWDGEGNLMIMDDEVAPDN